MKRSSSHVDRFIISAATMILIAASVLLWGHDHFFAEGIDISNLEQVGEFTIADNDVRRKVTNNFSWQPAQPQDTVFQGDTIFTGQDSEAKVLLKDGSVVEISKNSLIVIQTSQEKMNLELQYGSVVGKLKTPKKIVLKMKNSVTELSGKNSEVAIVKTKSGRTDFKVLKGKVKVQSGKKKTTLKKNEVIKISKEGETSEVQRIDISLIRPKNNVRIYQSEKTKVPFLWEHKDKKAKSFLFELSERDSFEDIIFSKKTTKPSLSLKGIKKSGSYYWRISSFDKKGKELAISDAFKVRLRNNFAPEAISPIERKFLEFDADARGKFKEPPEVELLWKKRSRNKIFEVQVAEDRDFKKIIFEEKTKKHYFKLPEVKERSYFWRVRATHPKRKPTLWSSVNNFSVKTNRDQLILPSPILINPMFSFTLPHKKGKKVTAKTHPLLKWQPLADAKSYQIEFSKDSKFKKVTSTATTSRSQYFWPQSQAGTHYWRVRGLTQNDHPGHLSEMGSFEVKIPAPKVPKAQSFSLPGNPDTSDMSYKAPISWSPTPGTHSYQIQYSTDKNFSKKKYITSLRPRTQLTLDSPGKTYWKVRSLDDYNEPLTGYSGVQTIDYERKFPLERPEVLQPANQFTIFMQKEVIPYIWFNWTDIPKTRDYVFQISNSPEFKKIILEEKTVRPKFLLKSKLPLGKIYWRVQAYSKQNKRSAWSETRVFSIELHRAPASQKGGEPEL